MKRIVKKLPLKMSLVPDGSKGNLFGNVEKISM